MKFAMRVGDAVLASRKFRNLATVALVAVALLFAGRTNAQTIPAEDYGPYNATILPDGPGLTKRLSPLPAPPSFFAKPDPNAMPSDERSVLLKGRTTWTLAFWFHSADLMTGTVIVAGYGDPAGEDARFIGVQDNHLALWLGTAAGKMIVAESALAAGDWHLAAAVGDGEKVTLFADGKEVATGTLAQGDIAAKLEMAPSAVASIGSRHFGGDIAGLKIWRTALTGAQLEAMAAAPLNFAGLVYEEGSKHWELQTNGMLGQVTPQDPSTLPRGKGGFSKPVAKTLSAAELRTELVGSGPWTIKGGWKLVAEPELKGAKGETLSKPGVDTKGWMVATVSGTVLTTMIDRGIYPDSDYGLNNLAIPESLAHQDYWYRVEFKKPAGTAGKRLTLTFEGVNYSSEVWLNGKKLGGFTGAFLRGKFDVTGALAAENVLAVRVSPVPHPGVAEEESIKAGPGENGGEQMLDGPTFGATEGWDWIPSIRDRNTGIWQDVTLTATDAVEVGDLNVVTTIPKADRTEADVEIEAPLTNASGAAVEGELTASFDNVKVTKRVTAQPGETVVRLEPAEFVQLKVQNPKLWWPNGYGEPTLHKLTVSFAAGGKLSSERKIDFGMREVSYETSLLDQTGHLKRVEVLPARTHDSAMPLINESHQGIRQVEDKTPSVFPGLNMADVPERFRDFFRFAWVQTLEPGAEGSASVRPVEGGWPNTDLVIKVNGVRIAARGGNWGMDDSRKRVSVEHLEPYFRLHRDAHVNIIRDWMGQNDEENFYALADKYGLMVWNDFWESTQGFNIEAQDPALFLKNAQDVILRYRHHPSIVVWCGRNEGVPQPIINEGLATLVRALDHTRYYTGSSNRVNLRNSGPYQYMALDTYYNINKGFSVELGIPSIPTLEAMKSFIPEADRWPISDTWAYHDFHVLGNGAVAPFLDHMQTEFGEATSLEDFVRKAQMLDYAGHRAIFEGMAAHLWEPNSGRLIWMTQPAWPSMEWNFLGSDYDTQSSFYGTQKACEPVHAQLNLADNKVDLINLGDAKSYKVAMRVLGLDGKVISEHENQVQAAANARTAVGALELEKLADGHAVLVELNVTDAAGAAVSNNLYWWAKDEAKLRELNGLAQVKLDASASVAASGTERKATVQIRNSGSVPALMIKLVLKDAGSGERILPAYYSENYLSLLPGEARTVTVEFPAGESKPAIGLRGWNIAEGTVEVK
jgi:hypothetical protein